MSDATPDYFVNVTGINTPRLDEYFGLWAMETQRGLSMFERARTMDLAQHVEVTATPRPSAGIKGFRVVSAPAKDTGKVHATVHPAVESAVKPKAFDGDSMDGDSTDGSLDTVDSEVTPTGGNVAVLSVVGTLMKQSSSLDSSTSTVVFRKQCRDIADDPRYQGCIVCFDTPGGSVAGTSEAAQAIQYLASKKPVIGHAQDLCASAGMWLASQCDELYANDGTALIGSIGTFIGTYDYSQWAENEGIQAKVYATGPLKGAGFPGTKITPEQDAYFQNIVDETQKFFAQAVATGRGMSLEDVNKVATGGVFMANAAVANGLIDGIQTFDQCLARMGELIAARSMPTNRGQAPAGNKQEPNMATENNGPAAGTGNAAPANAAKAELKRYMDAFGAANGATWYAEGKTFEEAAVLHGQATAEDAKKLATENASLRAKNDQLEARVKELRGASEGVGADLAPDKDAKGASKNPKALENRIGVRLARVARAIQLPSAQSKDPRNN